MGDRLLAPGLPLGGPLPSFPLRSSPNKTHSLATAYRCFCFSSLCSPELATGAFYAGSPEEIVRRNCFCLSGPAWVSPNRRF